MLEQYAVVLERKDRRIGEGAMVVIMANDQGSVVVVPVVLCCVVLRGKSIRVLRESQFVSVVLEQAVVLERKDRQLAM